MPMRIRRSDLLPFTTGQLNARKRGSNRAPVLCVDLPRLTPSLVHALVIVALEIDRHSSAPRGIAGRRRAEKVRRQAFLPQQVWQSHQRALANRDLLCPIIKAAGFPAPVGSSYWHA